MDYTVQYIVVVICFVIGLFFTVTNWYIFWRGRIKNVRRTFPRTRLSAALGILLKPNNETWYLCFIPLFADLGCIPLIIEVVICFIKDTEMFNHKKNKYFPY